MRVCVRVSLRVRVLADMLAYVAVFLLVYD